MSKITNVIILLYFVILLFGCVTEQDIELEQNIYNDFFEDLIGATITDYRKLTVPSPADFKDTKSIEILNKRIDNNEKKKVSPLIIYVNDTIKNISGIDSIYNKIKSQLSNSDYQSIVSNPFNNTKKNGVIKLKILNVDTSKYKLKHSSKKIKDKEKLKEVERDRISATYHLSRIFLNKEKTLGFFTLGLVHGRLNAISVIVIIKKEKEKWVIDKIIEDGIS